MIDVCPGYNYQSISVSSLSNDLSHPTHTGPPADTVINCSLSVDSRHHMFHHFNGSSDLSHTAVEMMLRNRLRLLT